MEKIQYPLTPGIVPFGENERSWCIKSSGSII